MMADPLVGPIIANVGGVRSSVISTVPVITIPLRRLVKVVSSVFGHGVGVSITSV